jgi:hypothetical protein
LLSNGDKRSDFYDLMLGLISMAKPGDSAEVDPVLRARFAQALFSQALFSLRILGFVKQSSRLVKPLSSVCI